MARIGIKGKVTFEVFGPDGVLKQRSVSHNLVGNVGDALIADCLAETPALNKVNNTNGKIAVGTGGITPAKASAWITTQTGSAEAMDTGYPQVKGALAAADDNVIIYKATFEAGDLNAAAINEAVLANAATSAGNVLAVATLTAVSVTAADTLAVTWEITILGA